MRKIILFPGQGFQNIKMLTSEVQEFCFRHNLGDLLNEVLRDKSKLFDTEYAQPLIIATQLVESSKYKELQTDNTEYVYAGFSLGEITALIASGAISAKEGLNFAKQRGRITKKFSETDLQANRKDNNCKRTFSVARIAYYEGLEHDLSAFNDSQQLLERIDITNYIPSKDNNGFVTITGESDKLKSHIEQFGGKKDQKMVTMQCPFHTAILAGLIPIQKGQFKKCVANLNLDALENVYSTRKCAFYSSSDTIETINNSLGEYLIQPMQHARTLDFFNKHYPDLEIVVSMGEAFSIQIATQYESIGGKSEQVRFIQDAIRSLCSQKKSQNNQEVLNL